jgi:hypothetical protein
MRFVEHKSTHSAQARSRRTEEDDHGELDPVIIKQLYAHEKLAEEIKKKGVDCESVELGSHPLERKQYYSQTFSMSPKFVTNRGLIKIKGLNVDYVQLLQRN